MSPAYSRKIEDKLESICGQGCSLVNQIIENERNGIDVEELAEFTAAEKRQIIDHLICVMSVYERDEDQTS